jgi:hypothetical protein
MRINGLDLIKDAAKTPEMRLRPYSDVPYASKGQQTPGTRAVARLNLSRLLSYLTRNVHPALCVIDECAVPFAGAPSGGCPPAGPRS